LVEIGSVVSEEKIFLKSHPPFFLFWAWWPSWLEVGITGHNFGRGPSKDHSTKILLQLALWFLRRRFLCEFPIGSYVKLSWAVGAILVEGPNTFLEENHPMTISSKFCSYWANGFRQEDFYLKGAHPGTMPARFGLIWFSGFREEDLNVIFYQNMPNLHNRYILAERKISQKNPQYMLYYSLPCSFS
jgi:hypothetical protein